MSLKSLICKLLPKNIYSVYRIAKDRIVYRNVFKKTQEHYIEIEQQLRQRKNSKIRFASYVVFDACFGASNLIELMFQNPDKYDVKFVIIPDTYRGQDHLLKQYNETKDFFVKRYGAEYVLDGYDIETNSFIDHSKDLDIIYLSNLYDIMVNEVHGIKYLSKQNVLTIYMSYGCMTDSYGYYNIMPLVENSLFWKVFADDKYILKYYRKYQLIRGKNVVLTGYSKMDSLVTARIKSRERKRVIIAPHHTVNNPYLPLSNFLKYSDFLLQLPKIFPQIDFVFRPHPLLFTNLVTEGIWTENQIKKYLEEIDKNGIQYSFGGDYLDLFVNSDALIHDCVSFIVEYLYTKKPCCFVCKNRQKKYFSSLGKKCLENYYKAYNENQIIDFIKNVVLEENDTLIEKRNKFMETELAVFYPNASRNILKELNHIFV